MDKLRAMQVFRAIADEGSLTRAAAALGSSLPSVVRTLAAFEATLGVRLFNRTTRRISLTEEGRRHLDSCRRVLGALDEAEAALGRSALEPAGRVAVTAPVLFGQMHVAPAVTRFLARYPRMQCSLLLLDRMVDLLEEGIDVGIRIGHLKDSALVARPFGEIRRVVVASPSYLRRHGVPRHPDDLLDANCLRNSAAPPPWVFMDRGRTLRVAVKGNFECNLVSPGLQACVDGAGVGMFFSYQVAPFIAAKQLRVVLSDYERPPRPLSLVYPHARLLPARARLFVDWIEQDVSGFRR